MRIWPIEKYEVRESRRNILSRGKYKGDGYNQEKNIVLRKLWHGLSVSQQGGYGSGEMKLEKETEAG